MYGINRPERIFFLWEPKNIDFHKEKNNISDVVPYNIRRMDLEKPQYRNSNILAGTDKQRNDSEIENNHGCSSSNVLMLVPPMIN